MFNSAIQPQTLDFICQDYAHCHLDNFSIKQIFNGLTTRESEVLYFLIRGYSAQATAAKLHLSQTTVSGYIENMKNRWRVKSKTELLETAIELGYALVQPNSLQHRNIL